MDEKFIRRFESFRNSLDSLAEAKQRDLSDSFVLSGTSAKFSITFDLAWKVMKDILVQYYAITGFVTGSPREVLRESFQANLITGDEWMDMLKVRNQLAHDYDGVIVKEHCGTIVHVYIDKLYDFKKAVEKLLNVNIVSGEVTYDVNGNIVSDTRVYKKNETAVNIQTWAQNYPYRAVVRTEESELFANTFSRSFLKLRRVAVTYDLTKFIQSQFIKGLDVTVFGNNLAVLKKTPYLDPDFGASDGDLQDPSARYVGVSANIKF